MRRINSIKLNDIKKEIVEKISTQELLSLHRRVHQLYSLAKRRKEIRKEFIVFLVEVHKILENEITRRNLNHKTPLVESYLDEFLKKLGG